MEHSGDATITINSQPEDYARSLVERAKDKCLIYKVHSGLRDGSDRHYEPVLVSIGPYRRGSTSILRDMEKHKVHYLQVLLDRKEQKSSDRYREVLKNEGGEQQALDCYVDTFQMDVDCFGECMVLDGFFIIELFRRNGSPGEYAQDRKNDMLSKIKWMKPCLARDLLLVENQIPLFVLRRLFALTEQTPNESDLVNLALGFFEFNGKPIPRLNPTTDELDNIPHLLGLVYNALVRETREQQNNRWGSRVFIRNAMTLRQSGVKFARAADLNVFYDIDFCNGVLSIPTLVIDENTEWFFRNLVAYEQYSEDHSLHQVMDYLRVMACLINSPKDVELLRDCEIVDNRMGDDVKVSAMFNQLCSGVYFDLDNFFYAQMFDDVNRFCSKRSNRHMARLRIYYFGRPWTVFNAQVALLTIGLATLQVMLAIYPPHKS